MDVIVVLCRRVSGREALGAGLPGPRAEHALALAVSSGVVGVGGEASSQEDHCFPVKGKSLSVASIRETERPRLQTEGLMS